MSNQSVSEIIDSWETHDLQNLYEINLDRIYAFPMARGDLHIHDNSVQWHLDHHGISRQRLVETKDEQVKSLMVDIEHQLRDADWLFKRTWIQIKSNSLGDARQDVQQLVPSEHESHEAHVDPSTASLLHEAGDFVGDPGEREEPEGFLFGGRGFL